MNEIEVTVQLRNNRVKALRLAAGLSQRQLGKKIGVCYAVIGQAERFRISPETKKKLATFFDKPLEWLFPPLLDELIKETETVATLPAQAVLAWGRQAMEKLLPADPFESAARKELAEQVREGIRTVLTPREQRVLQARFEDAETLTEAGGHVGVTRERVRQLEARAFRKLRRAMRQQILEAERLEGLDYCDAKPGSKEWREDVCKKEKLREREFGI